MGNLSKIVVVVFFLISLESFSQYGEASGGGTFLYRGDDVYEAGFNFHNVFYLGISNSFVKVDQSLSLPILLGVYLEYKYLFLDKNEVFNLSVSGQAHAAFTAFFLARIPVSLNIDFFNMATTEHKYEGIGFGAGIGYEPLVSTFEFNEYSPFIHFSLQVENFRFQYQYKLAQNLIINHGITFGMTLDL